MKPNLTQRWCQSICPLTEKSWLWALAEARCTECLLKTLVSYCTPMPMLVQSMMWLLDMTAICLLQQMMLAVSKYGIYLSTSVLALTCHRKRVQPHALHLERMTRQCWWATVMEWLIASTSWHTRHRYGKWTMLTEDQSQLSMLTQTTFSLVAKMVQSEYGHATLDNFCFSSMVSISIYE